MSDIIAVTNRHLVQEPFLTHIARLAAAHPRAIVLREKDLSEDAYRALATQVLAVARRYGTLVILHNFPRVARNLHHGALHLPLAKLRQLSARERAAFPLLGTSCHSIPDAREAEAAGCRYLFAGTIFPTNSKPGREAAGLPFLRQVVDAVSIPVYAIGGVRPDNIASVRETGAAGGCVMGRLMRTVDVRATLSEYN